MFVDIIKEFVL